MGSRLIQIVVYNVLIICIFLSSNDPILDILCLIDISIDEVDF